MPIPILRSLLALSLAALSTATAGAQTIVQTGDDLAAIVAAAADGAVIEIHSDATFVGTLTWNAKTITVQAGAGFAPVVRGDDGQHAAYLLPAVPPTVAHFKGLRIERGLVTPSFPFEAPALFLQCWDFAPKKSEMTLEDCSVLGQVNTGGTGTSEGKLTFLNTTFEGPVNIYGFLGAPLDVSIEDCVFEIQVVFICSAHLGTPRSANVTIRRSRFEKEVGLNAMQGGSLNAMIESCLVDATPFTAFGIRIYNDAVGTISNVTVTGCQTGIQGQPGISWHNMLLYGNGSDLVNVAATEIESSLISDGTYAGLNNNFAGTPAFGADHKLLLCSPGIDAGINTAPGLGATDLNGEPRFQDNDADFAFQVNVGATESTGSAAASAVVTNGNGINPLVYTNTNLPVVGSSYTAHISPATATFMTVIAIDGPAAPSTSSAWTGELLVNLTTNTIYDFALGPHDIPIPPLCGLVGLAVRSQGFRIDSFFGVVSTNCVNAIDLVIGG